MCHVLCTVPTIRCVGATPPVGSLGSWAAIQRVQKLPRCVSYTLTLIVTFAIASASHWVSPVCLPDAPSALLTTLSLNASSYLTVGALPHFSERISFAIGKVTDAVTDALAGTQTHTDTQTHRETHTHTHTLAHTHTHRETQSLHLPVLWRSSLIWLSDLNMQYSTVDCNALLSSPLLWVIYLSFIVSHPIYTLFLCHFFPLHSYHIHSFSWAAFPPLVTTFYTLHVASTWPCFSPNPLPLPLPLPHFLPFSSSSSSPHSYIS